MATYQNVVLPDTTRINRVELGKPNALRTFVAACLKNMIKDDAVASYCDPNTLSDVRLIVWYLGTTQFYLFRESDLFSMVTAPSMHAHRDVMLWAAITYAQSFVREKKVFVPAILIVTKDRSAFFPVRFPKEWDRDAERLSGDLPPVVVKDILHGVFHVASPHDQVLTTATTSEPADIRISILRGAPQCVAQLGGDHYRIRGVISLFAKEVGFVVDVASYDDPVKL